MTTLVARRALTPDGLIGPVTIEIGADGRIAAVAPATGPVPDRLIAPGFVDLQVNGIDDVDVASADGADWDRLAGLLLDQGTTAWCPTLITSRLGRYDAPLARVATAMAGATPHSPTILGVHLEGPFLGGSPGAHPRELIVPIDLGFLAALPDHVRLMTIGAEQALAPQAARLLAERGIVVSIGHSQPTEAEFVAAVAAGASMVTHLYNGMSGLHHRSPGLAAMALTEPSVATGLIADLIHVHPRLVRLAFSAQPAGSVVLVTDATAWRAGRAGEIRIELRDGAPRLADGTLAGSDLRMVEAVRNTVGCGVPLADALIAASTTPASVIGAADRGTIEVGKRADLVVLDDSLELRSVFVAGHQVR